MRNASSSNHRRTWRLVALVSAWIAIPAMVAWGSSYSAYLRDEVYRLYTRYIIAVSPQVRSTDVVVASFTKEQLATFERAELQGTDMLADLIRGAKTAGAKAVLMLWSPCERVIDVPKNKAAFQQPFVVLSLPPQDAGNGRVRFYRPPACAIAVTDSAGDLRHATDSFQRAIGIRPIVFDVDNVRHEHVVMLALRAKHREFPAELSRLNVTSPPSYPLSDVLLLPHISASSLAPRIDALTLVRKPESIDLTNKILVFHLFENLEAADAERNESDATARPPNKIRYDLADYTSDALTALERGQFSRAMHPGLGVSIGAVATLLLALIALWTSTRRTVIVAIGMALLGLIGGALTLQFLRMFVSPVPMLTGLTASLLFLLTLRAWEAKTFFSSTIAQLQHELNNVPSWLALGRVASKHRRHPSFIQWWKATTDLASASVQSLHAQQRFVFDFLDHLALGIVLLNDSERALWHNRTAMQMLALETQPGPGTATVAEVFRYAKGELRQFNWSSLISADSSLRLEMADGRLLWVGFRSLPAHDIRKWLDHQQVSIRTLVVISDISAMHQADLQRKNALRFLSHDLRAPLCSINAAASLLTEDRDQQAAYHRLQRLAEHAASVVNDFMSRARKLPAPPITKIPCSITQLIRSTADDVEPYAKQHSVTISVDAEHSIILDIDARSFQRALINCLENAIRATAANGTITVQTASSTSTVVISIINKPLATEDDDSLWPDSKTRLNRFGAGTEIVDEILKAHGGSFSIDLSGSNMAQTTMTLPLESTDTSPAAATKQHTQATEAEASPPTQGVLAVLLKKIKSGYAYLHAKPAIPRRVGVVLAAVVATLLTKGDDRFSLAVYDLYWRTLPNTSQPDYDKFTLASTVPAEQHSRLSEMVKNPYDFLAAQIETTARFQPKAIVVPVGDGPLSGAAIDKYRKVASTAGVPVLINTVAPHMPERDIVDGRKSNQAPISHGVPFVPQDSRYRALFSHVPLKSSDEPVEHISFTIARAMQGNNAERFFPRTFNVFGDSILANVLTPALPPWNLRLHEVNPLDLADGKVEASALKDKIVMLGLEIRMDLMPTTYASIREINLIGPLGAVVPAVALYEGKYAWWIGQPIMIALSVLVVIVTGLRVLVRKPKAIALYIFSACLSWCVVTLASLHYGQLFINPAPVLAGLMTLTLLHFAIRGISVGRELTSRVNQLNHELETHALRPYLRTSGKAEERILASRKRTGVFQALAQTVYVVQEYNSLVQHLLHRLPIGLVIVDDADTVLRLNIRAARFLELEDDNARGVPAHDLFRRARSAFGQPVNLPLLRTSGCAELVNRRGASMWVTTFALFDPSQGERTSTAIVMRDTSALRNHDRRKEQITQFLSHDMRALITSIQNLISESTRSGQRNHLSVDQLRLVQKLALDAESRANHFLSYAHVSSLTDSDLSAVSMYEVLDEVQAELGDQTGLNDLAAHADVACFVQANRTALKRILLMLFDALRRSPNTAGIVANAQPVSATYSMVKTVWRCVDQSNLQLPDEPVLLPTLRELAQSHRGYFFSQNLSDAIELRLYLRNA